MVFELLKERFILQWKHVMEMQLAPDKKLRTYAKFKVKFEFENIIYVFLTTMNIRKSLKRMRIIAHSLPRQIPTPERCMPGNCQLI